MLSSLGSHLDFPEHILMVALYRFIRNVQVVIKDMESYFSNPSNCLQEGRWEIILK